MYLHFSLYRINSTFESSDCSGLGCATNLLLPPDGHGGGLGGGHGGGLGGGGHGGGLGGGYGGGLGGGHGGGESNMLCSRELILRGGEWKMQKLLHLPIFDWDIGK